MGIGDAISGFRDRVSSGIDSVGETLSDGVDAVRETVSDGADAVGDAAGAVQNRVTESVEEAGDQFQAFAHDAGAAAVEARAQISEGVQSLRQTAAGVVDSAGAAIEEGGHRLQQAASDLGDEVTGTVRDGLQEAGRMAQDAGRELGELRDNVADGVRDLGQRAVDAGERGLQAVGEGLEQAGETARGVLEDAGQAAQAVGDAGRSLLGTVSDTFDPATHIAQLDSEGDSVSISLGGFAEAEIRGEAEGELQVTRTEDGYDVQISGDVGLGVIGELGGHGGAEAAASARGMLQAGGSVTLHADTPEEAARMVEIAGRMAAVGAAGAAGSGVGPVGTAIAGGAAQLAVGPSAEDMSFMADSISSVEVHGGAAVTLAAEAGIAETLNIEGSISGSQEFGAQLTFPERNEAGEVTRGARLSFSAEAQIEAEGSVGAGVNATGSVSGTVRLEQEVQLPTSVTAESLLRDPGAALRDVRDQTELGDATLTITTEAQGGVGGGALYVSAGAQAGVEAQIQIQGNPVDLARAGARAVGGDIDGALGGLDQGTTVTAELTRFENSEVSFSPEITAFGIGAGVEAQYQVHDQQSQDKIEGHPSEIARQVQAHLRSGG